MTVGSVSAVRSWEAIGPDQWLLCVGFGAEGHRVRLDRAFNSWRLAYVYQGEAEWRRVDGAPIAELDGLDGDPRGAMRWALEELAALARDRTILYTKQAHRIMTAPEWSECLSWPMMVECDAEWVGRRIAVLVDGYDDDASWDVIEDWMEARAEAEVDDREPPDPWDYDSRLVDPKTWTHAPPRSSCTIAPRMSE